MWYCCSCRTHWPMCSAMPSTPHTHHSSHDTSSPSHSDYSMASSVLEGECCVTKGASMCIVTRHAEALWNTNYCCMFDTTKASSQCASIFPLPHTHAQSDDRLVCYNWSVLCYASVPPSHCGPKVIYIMYPCTLYCLCILMQIHNGVGHGQHECSSHLQNDDWLWRLDPGLHWTSHDHCAEGYSGCICPTRW